MIRGPADAMDASDGMRLRWCDRKAVSLKEG